MSPLELLLPWLFVGLVGCDELRRVKAGEEYQVPSKKGRQGKGACLGSHLEEEKFKDCRGGYEGESLHGFTTEDIEKKNNVSLSEYAGQVLLVVNLASF